MAESLKSVASSCLSLTPPFSVVRDFFGYPFYDDQQTFNQPLSLKRQMELAQGEAYNLSIFLVGHENDFSGVVTLAQVRSIQFAIQRAREIYGQIDLGIRVIYWRRIGTVEAGGYPNIANRAEAENLTDDFSGPNDGIDSFFVQTIGDAGGWCNQDGPCDKDSKDDLTGVVVALTFSDAFLGVLFSHELGHYLGLPSGTSDSNLMGQDTNNDGIDELSLNSTGITNAQAIIMKGHCFVNPPC